MKKCTAYKKSILTGIGFLFFMAGTFAQDLPRIKQLYTQNKLQEAKEGIDSFTNNNTTSAAAFLLKANIYNAIAKDATARYLTADAKMEAFTALQKATVLDQSYVKAQLQPAYELPETLYMGYTNDGLALYNAGVERNNKASFEEALVAFEKAGTISVFINSTGWGQTLPDTANLYYCAKSSINAENETDAIFYCKKIIDNNLIKKKFSKGYEGIYQWLAYYYKQQQQAEFFDTYCAAGAKQFPNSVYFSLLQVDRLRQEKEYINMFAFYHDILNKQPKNAWYQLAYFNDLFNYIFQGGKQGSGKTLYADSLEKGLLKYLGTNPAANDARLLLGKFYTNQASDIAKTASNTKELSAYRSMLVKANSHFEKIIKSYSGKNKTALYHEAMSLRIANNNALNFLKTNYSKS